MSVHRPNALDVTSLGVLLSPAASAVAVGQVQWAHERPNNSVGTLAVSTGVASCRDGRLKIGLIWPRPDQITLAYIMNGVAVRQVCVNTRHNGWPVETHSHTYVPSTGEELSELLPAFHRVPRGPSIGRDVHRLSFAAFAKLVSARLPDDHWIEPQGGRP